MAAGGRAEGEPPWELDVAPAGLSLLPPGGFVVRGRLSVQVLRRGWVQIGCWKAPTRVLRRHAADLAAFAGKPVGTLEGASCGRRWRVQMRESSEPHVTVWKARNGTDEAERTTWVFLGEADMAAVAAVLLACCQMADRL